MWGGGGGWNGRKKGSGNELRNSLGSSAVDAFTSRDVDRFYILCLGVSFESVHDHLCVCPCGELSGH